jgi:hypothetical protein
MSTVVPFYRSADDPDFDDAAGGEDPPPMGETDPPDGEHELLRRAYGHMSKCAKHLAKALDLLDEEEQRDLLDEPFDDEPLGGPAGDDEVGPVIGYTDRRTLMRQYARALKFSMATNI